jgi:hypothetical protein
LVERLIGNGPLFLTTGHFFYACFTARIIFFSRSTCAFSNVCPSGKGVPHRLLARF